MKIQGKMMGLDFGDKTVGVAISDPLLFVARPLETIRRERPTKLRRTLARIEELIGEHEVSHIVLGLPLSVDRSEGTRVDKTKEFMNLLAARTEVPITLWDESYSSFEAEDVMREQGIARADYKLYVDQIAAAVILQSFIDNEQTTINK